MNDLGECFLTYAALTRDQYGKVCVGYGDGYLRFSYANSLENLSLAVERIRDWARASRSAPLPTGR